MAASGSRVLFAAPRCSAFATPITKPTTAPAARLADRSWQTARFRGCSRTTGPATWMNCDRMNAEKQHNLRVLLPLSGIALLAADMAALAAWDGPGYVFQDWKTLL